MAPMTGALAFGCARLGATLVSGHSTSACAIGFAAAVLAPTSADGGCAGLAVIAAIIGAAFCTPGSEATAWRALALDGAACVRLDSDTDNAGPGGRAAAFEFSSLATSAAIAGVTLGIAGSDGSGLNTGGAP